MTYILMTGAPGSKWSSVFKNIHRSADGGQVTYTSLTGRTYHTQQPTPATGQGPCW